MNVTVQPYSSFPQSLTVRACDNILTRILLKESVCIVLLCKRLECTTLLARISSISPDTRVGCSGVKFYSWYLP